MKIYTKSGDDGSTSLIGGTRVAKNSCCLEAYGGVDELNSYLGLLRGFAKETERIEELIRIQNVLFYLGGHLATDHSQVERSMTVEDEDITFLEGAIDKIDSVLPPLKSFILPGGGEAASFCHIARTVCRRVERRILDVREKCELDSNILRYINRLSDYLFVLARYFSMKSGAKELLWTKK
ncbi:MAG: cob(I)yrinic acid a,c-diamide adenosyltransferase [Culturomica sp.]|jgi:cob(I)alamin adenosyltransferase|nr:cob(I)yrinic acid a,c-diamide adenosyltransferase [Culturomica sp.]